MDSPTRRRKKDRSHPQLLCNQIFQQLDGNVRSSLIIHKIRGIGLSGSQYSPARRFCISRSEEFLSQMEAFLKIDPS